VSFPAYGTYNSTTNIDYVQASPTVIQGNNYWTQTADYIVKNDGVGGTYIDFYTASNVQYKTGSFLQTTNEGHDGGNVTLPYGLGTYPTAYYLGWDYQWNGSGGYTQSDYQMGNQYSGQIGANDYVNSSYTPNAYIVTISGSDYQNGRYTYYSIAIPTYSASDNQGNYHSYGTYITYDGTYTYYWDGNGYYYYY
jgi:hypothetical protein